MTIEAEAQPLFGAESYEQEVRDLVDELAPRRFAIFQDVGEQFDGRVAAWGLAFDDHIEIVDARSSCWTSPESPDAALRRYAQLPRITSRLIWIDPE